MNNIGKKNVKEEIKVGIGIPRIANYLENLSSFGY